jgi:protein-S-isoprenylcysteine O-methyltransferase Ste14
MKTLDKWEMQERNKVARVLTEEGVLSAVDHPFLATLYCTIQAGARVVFWGFSVCFWCVLGVFRASTWGV